MAAVGFNVIANWFLIPRYSFVAAGVITVLSEVVLLVLFATFLRRRNAGANWPQLVARPLLLTALMLAVMWLGSQLHLLVALVLGAAVYGVGLFALRIIGPEERAVFAAILPGALARRLGWA